MNFKRKKCRKTVLGHTSEAKRGNSLTGNMWSYPRPLHAHGSKAVRNRIAAYEVSPDGS